MMPILYPADELAFDTNGLGILSDAISCEVSWERNGQYELVLVYPTEGIHAGEIADSTIILAQPAPDREPQPFRIYRLVPTSAGKITCYARHIAYDLQGIPAAPFSATPLTMAMAALRSNAVVDCPFRFSADFSAGGTLAPAVPKPIWELMGSGEDGILGTYGGEWEFDRLAIQLHQRLGADTGYTIRYGKNLKTLEMDKNIANCYTGIYPYWADSEGNLVQLPEHIINAEGSYAHTQILPVDLSSEFEEAPTAAELRLAGQEYILANNIGIPTISWKIEFVDLRQTEEYKNHPGLGTVSWGDTVGVVFPKLGVNASARVVATRHDVLRGRYINITLGSVQASLADTIVANKRQQQLKLIQQQREYLAKMKKIAADAEAKAQELADQAEANATEAGMSFADDAEKNAKSYAKSYTDLLDSNLAQDGIFGRLTGGLTGHGIELVGGKIRLNLSYLASEHLDATNISLDGLFSVYGGGVLGGYLGYMSGSDGESTTKGVALMSPNKSNYVILTDAGARLQVGDLSLDLFGSMVKINGNLHVTGQITQDG